MLGHGEPVDSLLNEMMVLAAKQGVSVDKEAFVKAIKNALDKQKRDGGKLPTAPAFLESVQQAMPSGMQRDKNTNPPRTVTAQPDVKAKD